MRSRARVIKFSILLSTSLSLIGLSPFFSTLNHSACRAAAQDAVSTPAAPPAAPVSLTSTSLTQKGQNYKLSPDDATWQEFLQAAKSFFSDARVLRASSAQVIQQNPALRDVQTKVFDAGGARVWTFPGSKHSRTLLIQSGGSAAPAASPDGTVAPPAPQARVSLVDYPDTVNISAAKIIRSFTTATRAVKVGRRKIVQKTVQIPGPSFLVVAGLDRVSGIVWLGAYKPYNGQWMATNELFSQIPAHFLETVSGQASFSGNDIILAVSSQEGSASGLPRPKSTSYQIVLKFSGGHYVLAGSPSKDVPVSIVSYFVQCLRMNRQDLAKAWLADPALISIPKYIGLWKNGEQTYKLVTMSQPASGGSRFRLVTNSKNDLIFDVGIAKKQLLIKGIFIAPPDPLAKTLTGTIIGNTPPPASPTNGESTTAPAAVTAPAASTPAKPAVKTP